MRLIDLNEENASEYANFLGADIAENLERTYFRGMVAIDDTEEPVAGMMWEMINLESEDPTESHIPWIVVKDMAAGEEMLKAYGEKIAEEGSKRSTAAVYTKKNSPEIQILKQFGFPMKLTEGDHITVLLSELSQMPLLKSRKIAENVKPLSEMTQRTYRRTIQKLVSKKRTGLCRDISELPRSWFENDISCYCEDEEGVTGMILLHKTPSGKLEIKLMFTFGKDKKETAMQLQYMIRQVVVSAEEMYSPETEFVVERHNETSLLLSEKLFPRGFGRPVYVGERKEEE